MGFQPLLTYERNRLTENTFFGALSVYQSGRVIHQIGRNPLVYARSLLKPFYTRPYAKVLSDLSSQQKAIVLSSHNGSPSHVKMARSLLSKEQETLLLTPESEPLMPEVHYKFSSTPTAPTSVSTPTAPTSTPTSVSTPTAPTSTPTSVSTPPTPTPTPTPTLTATPTKWIHNSSGHHAGIVLGLIRSNVSPLNYTHKSHVVFQNLKAEIARALGGGYQLEKLAKDGDGLPTLAMKLNDITKIYSYLSETKDQDWIWSGFVSEPYFIGGEGRLDTAINRMGRGELIAKEGADGLLAVSSSAKGHWSFTIKMAHGWDTRPTWLIARSILKRFGFDLPSLKEPSGQKVVVNPQIESLQTL